MAFKLRHKIIWQRPEQGVLHKRCPWNLGFFRFLDYFMKAPKGIFKESWFVDMLCLVFDNIQSLLFTKLEHSLWTLPWSFSNSTVALKEVFLTNFDPKFEKLVAYAAVKTFVIIFDVAQFPKFWANNSNKKFLFLPGSWCSGHCDSRLLIVSRRTIPRGIWL